MSCSISPEPVLNRPPEVFDRALLARRLGRRAPDADFVTALVRDDLADRLAPVTRSFESALIMGPDAAQLPEEGRSANGPFAYTRVGTMHAPDDAALADPEDLVLPRTDHDLIVSLLDVQTVNDVPGFLARIKAHLRPDGLFIAATLGGASLTELRRAWLEADALTSGGAFARVAPLIDVRDAGALLQRAGFALPVTDTETHKVRYQDPLALMRELRAMGASNPLAERPDRLATRTTLAAAVSAYEALAGEPDGRVRATLEIIWMSGWAPDESQQKPMRPGSAEVSLTKVLGRKDDQRS